VRGKYVKNPKLYTLFFIYNISFVSKGQNLRQKMGHNFVVKRRSSRLCTGIGVRSTWRGTPPSPDGLSIAPPSTLGRLLATPSRLKRH